MSPHDGGESKNLKDDLGVATNESLQERQVDDKGSIAWDAAVEENLADHSICLTGENSPVDHATNPNNEQTLVAEPQDVLHKIVEQSIHNTSLVQDSESCEIAPSQSSAGPNLEFGGKPQSHTDPNNANITSVDEAVESSMVSVEGDTKLLPQAQEHISTPEEPKSKESIATEADATSKLTRKPRTLPALHHQPQISKIHARANEELDVGILRPHMGNGRCKKSSSIDSSEMAEGQALVDGSTVVLWKGNSRAPPATLD